MAQNMVYRLLVIKACLLFSSDAADRRRGPDADECPRCEGRNEPPPPGTLEYLRALDATASDMRTSEMTYHGTPELYRAEVERKYYAII